MKVFKELLLFAGISLMIIYLQAFIKMSCAQETNNKPDIVFCSAPWCSGCKAMKPIINELEKEGYSVYRPKQAEWPKYQVRYIPTTIVYSNGVELKRFTGKVSKAVLKAYLPRRIHLATTKDIKIVLAGYDDRRFTISVIGRVLAKEGIRLVHLERKDYARYGVTSDPTIIFYENGVEKYRLCAS